MRRVLGLAVLVSAVCCGAAHAADLGAGGGAGYGGSLGGPRAGQIVFWDFEPGVVVRAYWLPPYGNRHFFPTSNVAPKLGRQENLSKPSQVQPAKSFYREWDSPPPLDPAPPPPMMVPPAPLPAPSLQK